MGKDNLVLGIIGGSGVYDIYGVENSEWVKVTTPYGNPSDKIFTGSLNGIKVAFLPTSVFPSTRSSHVAFLSGSDSSKYSIFETALLLALLTIS